MKKINSGIIVFFITCAILFSAAKNINAANIIPVTIEDAIKTAIANNPMLKASVFSENMAQSRLDQAKSGFMPKINFTEKLNRTDNPMWAFGTLLNQGKITRDDFDPASLNNPDPINNCTSLLSVVMPVYQGGRIYNTFKIAETNRKIALIAHKKTKQAVIAQTAIAYNQVLLAQKNLQVVMHALKSANASLKLVESRFSSGFSVKSDLLRAKVRIADLEQQRLNARSNIEIAKGYLNTAMGMPLERPVNVAAYFNNSTDITGDQDKFITIGLKNRPELMILNLRKKIAQSEIKIAEAGHLPSVNLFGTYENNSEHLHNGHNDYTIGAVMNINLFSGFGIHNKIKSAEAGLGRINELEKNMRLAVKIQIKKAWLNRQTSWQRIHVAESALKQATENLRIVKNRYENGLLTIVSLLDAELADQMARANHFQAVYDYESARIKLALADGTIDTNFK